MGMKVFCINNIAGTNVDANRHSLTIGKWYDVLSIYLPGVDREFSSPVTVTSYQIRTDDEFIITYPANLFKTLEEVREEKLNGLLDE